MAGTRCVVGAAGVGLLASRGFPGIRRSRSSSGTPKLYYYPARGKANFIRVLLAEAGVDFEDVTFEGDLMDAEVRAKFCEDCKQLGGNLTTNLPMLYIDGMYLTQSSAIVMYTARKYGLYPAGLRDAYLVDNLLAAAEDLRSENYRPMAIMGGGEKEKAQYKESVLPVHLSNFARLLGDNPFFCGTRTTCADIAVWEALSTVSCLLPGALDAYPSLKGFVDRVEQRPNVAKYLASEQFQKLWAFPALW